MVFRGWEQAETKAECMLACSLARVDEVYNERHSDEVDETGMETQCAR